MSRARAAGSSAAAMRSRSSARQRPPRRRRGCDPEMSQTRSSRRVSLEPVFVLEAAQDWNAGSHARMWPAAVVVMGPLAENGAKLPFAHPNHEVQAFATVVTITRSQKAFTCGARTGVLRTVSPIAATARVLSGIVNLPYSWRRMLAPGTRIGAYEVIAALGAGGMGEVYRARDTRLGRDVALKVLPRQLFSDPSGLTRFEREARQIAALNHPNIVAIFDTGRDGEIAYIATELVDGTTLRESRLPVRKVAEIGAQLADALAAAHRAGVTHRDIKPDNVMVTREGRVKLLDFGVAKVTGPFDPDGATLSQTVDGSIVGTVGYMAPEQLRAGPCRPPDGHLCSGRTAVRATRRRPSVQRRHGAGDHDGDAARRSRRPTRQRPRRSSAHRSTMPREESRRAISIGRRPGLCAAAADWKFVRTLGARGGLCASDRLPNAARPIAPLVQRRWIRARPDRRRNRPISMGRRRRRRC